MIWILYANSKMLMYLEEEKSTLLPHKEDIYFKNEKS